jgi:hypothetical protein
MSNSTGAAEQGTKSEGSSTGNGSDRKQGFVLGFLGTLPGIITAVAALITAIAGAFLGGAQLASQPQAQPTVYVTVTAPPSASSASSSPAARPNPTTAPPGSAASTGAPPATDSGTPLSSLTPVQNSVDNFTASSPQKVGTTLYSDAIRFSCSSASDPFGYNSVVYNVAGYTTLNATFGIPDNAGNAANNSATIKFFKDGGSTELGQPFTIALDSTQQVSLNLQGSSQLEISCVAANEDSTTSSGDDIDVAIGNARLSPP